MLDFFSALIGSLESLDLFGRMVDLYGEWIIFLSVFLTGETAVLISFMLSEIAPITYRSVLFLSVAATLLADLFWFTFGNVLNRKTRFTVVENKLAKSVELFLDQRVAGRVFLPLLLLKFFIGTRLLVILYFARKGVRYTTFVLYDAVSVLLYVYVLSLMAKQLTWLTGSVAPSYVFSGVFLTAVLFVWLISSVTKYFFTKSS